MIAIKQVAKINEDLCIGCYKCILACPEQAIIGAARYRHGILDHLCTGCALCISPCPTDCISLIPLMNT